MKNATSSPKQPSLTFNYGKVSVRASTIKYAESIFGSYTILKFTNRKQILSSYTLGHYCSLLQKSDSFFTVRKGLLINLSFMKEAEKREDGLYAIMKDGSEFRVSRRKGKALMQWIIFNSQNQ